MPDAPNAPNDAPRPTLHMIGNGHIDPVWLWPWPEGFQEVTATFRAALDRIAESDDIADDFIFTASSAAMYEWVERQQPAMFEEIQRRVEEGRWVIVGGWWVQPDCNLPSGESFVRQALYGQRYFQEKFGRTATVGYNVDSFGHHAMLPQLLRKSGLDAYVFMRPQEHEMGLPGRLFQWEAPDGSRVLAFRIPFAYTSAANLPTHVARCAAELGPPLLESMCFYGVGNHGGGPTKASLDWIHQAQAEAQANPEKPLLAFSSPDRYFADIRALDPPLPTVHGELQHHASGCYAAHSGVKRWNREAEALLGVAETWTTIAGQVQGREVPTADFAHAWRQVLFNQFHDILAGTSLASAYEDARDTYGEAKAIASRHLHGALQSLSWAIDIPPEDDALPVVVFNPHPWPVSTGVEVECGRLPEPFGLVDETGTTVAVQLIEPEAAVSPGSRNRFCFVAGLLPMGYRTYRAVAAESPHPGAARHPSPNPGRGDETTGSFTPSPPSPPSPPLVCDEEALTIANGRLRLRIDQETGTIAELYDIGADVQVLGRLGARPIVIADASDTWGHDVLRFDEEIGTFAPTRVRLVERGPVRATIRVESAYERSTLMQDFSLYARQAAEAGQAQDALKIDAPVRVEVRVEVDWHERHKLLKLAFPLNLDMAEAVCEIPYGHLARPGNGEEEPGQRWLDLTGPVQGSGTLYGLSLLNDAKASYSATRDELRLTVLRSPIAAHHDPAVPDPDRHDVFLDQGVQTFRYALLPHEGTWKQANTIRHAAELCTPPIPVLETSHPGPLPQTHSFLAIESGTVALGALKSAEDGEGTILRLYETDRTATRARIALPAWGRTIEAEFAPCEIKTFLVLDDVNGAISEVDLPEWDAKSPSS